MATVTSGSLSSNTIVNGILWNGWKWTSGSGTTVINYYFSSDGADSGVQGWSTNEKAAFRAALSTFSAVCNVSFNEVNTRASANFIESVIGEAQLPAGWGGLYGRHEWPEKASTTHDSFLGPSFPTFGPNQAGGYYNYQMSGSHWGLDLPAGSMFFRTFVHELGHGLGLKHPWLSGATFGTALPNATGPLTLGDNNLNHSFYSMMAYADGYTFDAEGKIVLSATQHFNDSSGNKVWGFGYNSTPMALDIAALQYLYGAKASNTGNNSYRLQDSADSSLRWECIWDTGGTDEIYYDGSRNAIIDLTAATLDSTVTGGGVLSYATGVRGGFTIANGVIIEKATGGSGNDTLSGNNSANIINGRGGADVLSGRGGGDTFVFDNNAYSALDRVTDYDKNGGDAVDISALVYHSYFTQPASSLVRAVADASNSFAILQVDTDGLASGPNWRDIARLDNVQHNHLVRALLTPSGSWADVTVIRAPVITSNGGGSSTSTTIAENSTHVTTIHATNYASGTLSFSLSGTSAHLFSIDLINGGASANIFFRNAPNYENPSERSFSFDVNVYDANGLSDAQSVFVGVTNVQEAPVFAGGSSATVNVQENKTSVLTVGASDPEGTAVTYSLVGGIDRSLFTITSGGQLSFLSARDYENPGDSDRNNSYLVQVRATDATGLFSDQTVTVNVTDVAENAPRFTSHGGVATAHVNMGENTTSVTTLTAVDPDGTTPTLSIVSGLDSAFFSLVNGVLSFTSAPDHEAPADSNRDNWYEVVVRASDGSLFADQKIVAIVNNVNEAPRITTNGGGATATINVQENLAAAVTTVVGSDPEGAGLVYSIVGGADAARFGIGVFNGMLTFNATPDFESPADSDRNNSYTVIVRASDGGAADDQVITVNVGNVAEAPVITSWGGGVTATVAVASGALVAGTVTAYDGDGTTPTYAIAGGADAARFQINATTGVLSFRTAPDVTAPTDANQDNSYVVTVAATDGLLSDQQTLRIHVTRGTAALIDGTEGDDNRSGTTGKDDLNGLGGHDILSGGDGDDALNGGDGNDSLYGGLGADANNGGAGMDFARYDNATSRVAVFMWQPGANTGEAAGDTFTSIEGLVGSSFDDTLGADEGNNIIYGQGGHDVLFGAGGSDSLYGGAGDDSLFGGTGADSLFGDAGFDWARYDFSATGLAVFMASPASSTGEAAGDTFSGIEGIVGTNSNDTLGGDESQNVLIGLNGHDVLFGAGGADSLYGANGDDSLFGGTGGDYQDGGIGYDYARYDFALAGVTLDLAGGGSGGEAAGDIFAGVEGVTGSNHADQITGDGQANVLFGFGGADILIGRDNVDSLFGGAGGDQLFGGNQQDFLFGEGGADIFVFGGVAEALTGVDSIQDFSSTVDKIGVAAAGFGISGISFTTGSVANAAGPQFIYNPTTRTLLFDPDGTGSGSTAVSILTVQNGGTIAAGDLVLI
jgi:Ca2+-binding RTX toxin-like protein